MANEKKSYYAIIPANVRYDKELPANAKLLYGEITALCNETGRCWAGNEYFANLYGVSTRTIRTWLSTLEQQGYIHRTISYKDKSKEVYERYITLAFNDNTTGEKLPRGAEENFPTTGEKLPRGAEENFHTPTEENCHKNTTVFNNTLNNTSNNKYMCAFESLWSLYPRKKEKAKAYKCYQARLKEGYSSDEMLQAVKAYAAECKKNNVEDKFIKLCSTFLGPNIPFTDYITKGGQADDTNNGSDAGLGTDSQSFDNDDLIAILMRDQQRRGE